MKKIVLLSILLIFTSLGCDIIKIKSKDANRDNLNTVRDNTSTSIDNISATTKISPPEDMPVKQNENLSAEANITNERISYQDNKTLIAIQFNTKSIIDIKRMLDNFSTEIKASTLLIDNFATEIRKSISFIDNVSINMLEIDKKISKLDIEQKILNSLINKYKRYILIAGAVTVSIFIIVALIIIVISGNLRRIKKMIVNGMNSTYHKDKNMSDENIDTTAGQVDDSDNNSNKK